MVNPHLPQPATLRCLHIKIEPEVVTIAVESLAPSGVCPLCAHRSARQHSRYLRRLGDLPWQGRSVRLLLLSHKFSCDVSACPRRIFAERLPNVTRAYARNTDRLADTFASIAFACGGEAGSRLARQLGMPISPDTLLRTIRRTHIPIASTFRILGVDDWAMRKGLRYGTLICDHEQRRPIDVLDDREPETLAAWLREHPEVEVITRDRAHCYARAASMGAPQAIQVADRFHLMQNLQQAMARMLDHRHPQLKLAMRDVAGRDPPTTQRDEERQRDQERHCDEERPNPTRANLVPRRPTHRDVRRNRRLEKYEQVMELRHQGLSDRKIARHLSIHRETVGRYTRAGEFPERATCKYASKTDRFTEHLEQRWKEGCHNAAQLFRELEVIGFTGSYCSVRRRVAHWDRSYGSSTTIRPPNMQPPSARRLARLLLKNPADLDKRDRSFVDALLERCSEIRSGTELAREFAAMVRGEGVETLDSWIQRAWDFAVPREIRTFATSLKSDFDAVHAGLTTVWNNGLLEGQVNRLKLIKRQMYGRANFDLLRQRVLYTG
ncbi:MAG: ISL3 family transposase [Planctomycetes bacterium]|nr:ISL3 family transposase [Planctomycetota bacterium]